MSIENDLRREAEFKSRQRLEAQDVLDSSASVERVHELEVHQIELEIQNEALQLARNELENERQKYADMFYDAPIAYMVCDENGLMLEVNHALLSLLNAKKSDMVGGTIASMATKEYLDVFHLHCKEVLRKGKLICEMELLCAGRNLLHVIIESVVVQVDEHEKHVRSAIVDISQRKRMEQQLREAQQKAESASQAKTNFLAMMSHELRTPLHGIIGLQNMLAKEADYLQLEHRNHLNLALHSSNVLKSLIDDILDLSKIEAGKMEMGLAEFSLVKSMQHVLVSFAMPAVEKKLELKFTYQNIPAIIFADEAHIRQVLLNLIGNAIKFTDQGYVHVNVDYHDGDQASYEGLLSIAIEDSGVGIQQYQLSTIFEAFIQFPGNRSRKGTGLGTTIAKRLVTAMSGKIHVQSEKARGSIFTITLPVKKIGSQLISGDVDVFQVPDQEELSPLASVQGLRVLLAEDDPISLMVALESLKHAGLNIDTAEHGLGAWKKIKESDYDVLITDIRMPGLDGIELTRHIRKRELKHDHRTQIIGLSAHAMEDVVQHCLAVGMDDFLSKPISPDDLLRKLDSL